MRLVPVGPVRDGFTICSYIKDEEIFIDNAEELECVIDMPYDVNLNEEM